MTKTTSEPLAWAAFLASLPPEEREVAAQADALLEPAAKNEVENTFIKGEAILFVKERAQSRTFSEWCRHKEFDRSAAYKLMDVVKYLAPLRSRFVAARVQASALLDLARFPGKADEILNLYESGQACTVKKVKELLGITQKSASDAKSAIGGPKGVKRLIDEKRRHIPEFIQLLARIIAAIDDALAAERLVKGSLVEKVAGDARWAHRVLLNLCAFIEPLDHARRLTRPTPFPEESPWHEVEQILFVLGRETWPPIQELEPWLRGKVLPRLEWAGRGEVRDKSKVHKAVTQKVVTHSPVTTGNGSSLEDGSYLLPEHFAFDGEEYQVMLEHASGWQDAILQDKVWTIGGQEVRPVLIRLHEALISAGIRNLADECRSRRSQEFRQKMARNISAALIFGEEFAFGSAPEEEPVLRIAEALIRDMSGNVRKRFHK